MVEELFAKMAAADQAGVVRKNNIRSVKKKKQLMGVHAVLHRALL